MAFAKTEEFSPQTVQISRIARALSHPARVAIIDFLLKSEGCFCGAIVDALPLSQATVSQHLKELKEVGLITGTIEGPRICYCINEEAWLMVRQLWKEFFDRSCCNINNSTC